MKRFHRASLISTGLITASLIVYFYWWRTTEVVFIGNLLQASALAYCGMKFNVLALNAIGVRRIWRAWAGVAAGVWCWFVAQFLETYWEMILAKGAYGTVADCFWGLGAVVYLAGTILLLREFWIKDSTFRFSARASIALLLIIGSYFTVFTLGILPHLMDPSRSLLLKVLDFAYPTTDFSTAFCYCLLFFLARARNNEDLATGALLVCLAFALFSFCDLAWAYFRNVNSLLYRLQDVAFFFGYCLNGIAAIPFESSEDFIGGRQTAQT